MKTINHKLKSLALQIDTARMRLKAAIETKDWDATLRAQRLVTMAQAEFYDLAKKQMGMQQDDNVLVYCDAFPDGAVLDQATYRVLLSLMEHGDRECHQAVSVDLEASDDIQAVVFSMLKGQAS